MFSTATFRSALLSLLLLGTGLPSWGSITSYTDRGKADFDLAMQTLNPYGTWSKIDGIWAYTPLDHQAPYTHGRWIYTEFGWLWKGDLPHSWVTEHYGYWKRGANQIWSWFPGPYWLPEIVELRMTPTHIGWRSAAVDNDGNFVESPVDRYSKTDEWTFVTMAQFAGPITPAIVAKPDVVKTQLENSTECRHTYVTYREIDRPGPHPADFLPFIKDRIGGGMFAPMTLEDQYAEQQQQAAQGLNPALVNGPPVPVPGATPAGTNGAPVDPEKARNERKVHYWITMSLPTIWTKPPPEAQAKEIYLYRPDFYQDNDGIARRITLWLDPASRKASGQSLAEILGGGRPAAPASTNASPAKPAVPVSPTPVPPKKHDPFRSPFDDNYHGNNAHTSSKATNDQTAPVPPPTANPAPDGRSGRD